MKRVFIIVAICSGIMMACKKDKHSKSDYPFVYLNHCMIKEIDHNEVRLCFDEVVSDNRCPDNKMCVLEGTAVATFTFAVNGNSHRLTLSTLPLNVPFAKDTVVENYKLELVNIKPTPVLGPDAPKRKIYAEVRISKR